MQIAINFNTFTNKSKCIPTQKLVKNNLSLKKEFYTLFCQLKYKMNWQQQLHQLSLSDGLEFCLQLA